MAMSSPEHFQAALKMIQLTPQNVGSLTAEMILHVAEIIAEADNKFGNQPSVYDDQSKEGMKKQFRGEPMDD
jgi:hypothetical protein